MGRIKRLEDIKSQQGNSLEVLSCPLARISSLLSCPSAAIRKPPLYDLIPIKGQKKRLEEKIMERTKTKVMARKYVALFRRPSAGPGGGERGAHCEETHMALLLIHDSPAPPPNLQQEPLGPPHQLEEAPPPLLPA